MCACTNCVCMHDIKNKNNKKNQQQKYYNNNKIIIKNNLKNQKKTLIWILFPSSLHVATVPVQESV